MQVAVDDVQDVEQLPLIFVDTLHLHIIKGVKRDIDICMLLDPPLQLELVLALDIFEGADEVWVVGVIDELLQRIKISDPFIDGADSLADQVRKTRVAAVKPAAGRHTICLVLDLSRIHTVELREDRRFDEFGMQGGYTIDCMRADDGQIGHANLLIISLFDQGHTLDLLVVTRTLLLHGLKEVVIDQVNNFHVPGQQLLNESDRPLL